MRKFKQKLQDAKVSFVRYEQLKEKAYTLDPAYKADEILSLLEESKKCRRKATKQLSKIAEECGFKILKNIKDDSRFNEVWNSINCQIDRALEAFYNISRFNHSIELV